MRRTSSEDSGARTRPSRWSATS
ncbi:UNVERIFIED_CONTAM: hypothetical protein GTU68_024627 [Idotea baltica]|nr:hypothetical protein [Idotea baltica]